MSVASDGGLVGAGKIVLLEPDRWLDQPFAVARYIDTGEQLRSGQWTVVFYHHDCPDCRSALPGFERLAREGTRVALIEIPPFATSHDDPVRPDTACLRGRLRADKEWFVETPAVLELRDGKFVRYLSPKEVTRSAGNRTTSSSPAGRR